MSGSASLAQPQDFTVDAFHRGDFHLVQPRKGHRAGMDAMMLAAAVPSLFAGRIADLGAGAGAAGLAVISRCTSAKAVLVEREPEMADYARKSLALEQNARIARRAEVLEADVTLGGKARAAAGLADDSFDFAIMNPPFNERADRASPDEMRRAAHVMEDHLFDRWLKTASAIVRPRGGLALIARPQSLLAILAALEGRFGDAQIVPIHPRPDEPAIRIVLRAVQGSRAALSLMPALFVHDVDGRAFGAHADAISNGRATLFND